MQAELFDDPIVQRLIAWGRSHDAIRAMLLTSTRADPAAPVDLFSDYDVVLVVTDIQLFFADRSWLEAMGKVLVVYRDPITLDPDYGVADFAYITQYEDRTKIDFTVAPVELMPRLVAAVKLPDYLDVGYAVLLDKDGLTQGLRPPTYTAYIPTPPSQETYTTLVEEFFHEATYVAKHLWRGDLMPAKYNLDYAMKQVNLRTMLEWRIEVDAHWTVRPGANGKRLRQRLPPETWAELEQTYVGAGEDENWDALFRTIDLFRKTAVEVGDRLGYTYPDDLDARATAYLRAVQALDKQA